MGWNSGRLVHDSALAVRRTFSKDVELRFLVLCRFITFYSYFGPLNIVLTGVLV